MITPKNLAPVLLAICTFTGSSMALAQPKTVDGVLTDGNGMSLYIWDNDVAGSGKSLCDGACSLNWPPMVAPKNAKPSGDFTLIEREDGKRQWAYKGKPLYKWSNDKKPGDRTGDGFRGGIWHVAKP